MKNEYVKNIDTYKEVLQALPKNNDKNKKIYLDKVRELIIKYKNDFALVKKEIEIRNKCYLTIEHNEKIEVLNKEIDEIRNGRGYVNKYSRAYEKSGLDVKLYQLGHYYTIDLEMVNDTIIRVINIFREVGVDISIDEINYSYYANKYLNKLYMIRNDSSYQEQMKQVFEEIYWKCPDIINHITLNFKYLYYKYEKFFDKYSNEMLDKYSKLVLDDDYENKCILRDNLIRDSKDIIINKFISGELNINDYTSDKIDKLLENLLDINNYKKEDIIDLDNTLYEYREYLMLSYLIIDMKNLYNDRDKYKGIFNKKMKEIKKIEKSLFKDNAKVKKNNKKFDYYNNKINSDIMKLKECYEELERDYFLEQISMLGEDATIFDLISLASSNYNYLVDLFKKNDKNIKEELKRINDLVNYPYINIINNIWIKDEKEIDLIIVDKYNLYGFKLNREMLSLDNIDKLISDIKIIIDGKLLEKHNLSDEKIKFIKDSNMILLG